MGVEIIYGGDFNSTAHQSVDAMASIYHRAARNSLHLILRSFGRIDCYRALEPNMKGFTFPASMPAPGLDYLYTSTNSMPCFKN
jgi:hypothetical protein